MEMYLLFVLCYSALSVAGSTQGNSKYTTQTQIPLLNVLLPAHEHEQTAFDFYQGKRFLEMSYNTNSNNNGIELAAMGSDLLQDSGSGSGSGSGDGDDTSPPENTNLIIGLVVGIVIVVAISAVLLFLILKRRKAGKKKRLLARFEQKQLPEEPNVYIDIVQEHDAKEDDVTNTRQTTHNEGDYDIIQNASYENSRLMENANTGDTKEPEYENEPSTNNDDTRMMQIANATDTTEPEYVNDLSTNKDNTREMIKSSGSEYEHVKFDDYMNTRENEYETLSSTS